MNKLKISLKKLLCLAIVLLTFSACQNKEPLTILAGKMSYLKNDSVILVKNNDYFPGRACISKQMVAKADSTGYFIFKSDQIEPGFYQVLCRNYPRLQYDIYLEPGDSIYIETIWGENPGFYVSGNGAEKLKSLETDFNILYKNSNYRDTIRSSGFETELLFKAFIDSIQTIRIQEVEGDKTILLDIKTHLLNRIQADHAKTLLYHLEGRNRNMDRGYDYFYPDSTYYSFLDNLGFDSRFCESKEAMNLAQPYLENRVRIAFIDKSEEEWWYENLFWKWNFITEQAKSTWTDFLALSTIEEYSFGLFSDDFFDKLEAFQKNMDSLFLNENYREIFQLGVSEYQKLEPGKPAPDFALPDSAGNIVHLSDFRGKIVYVDFWGTWCYPCIQEIPGALKIQEKYKDKPVVFLYVAMEYDEEDIAHWRQFIRGENERFGEFLDYKPFPGIHLVAEEQFRNPDIRPYKINLAPTFVLVDSKGTIVDARAERPDEISEHIDRLLNEMN